MSPRVNAMRDAEVWLCLAFPLWKMCGFPCLFSSSFYIIMGVYKTMWSWLVVEVMGCVYFVYLCLFLAVNLIMHKEIKSWLFLQWCLAMDDGIEAWSNAVGFLGISSAWPASGRSHKESMLEQRRYVPCLASGVFMTACKWSQSKAARASRPERMSARIWMRSRTGCPHQGSRTQGEAEGVVGEHPWLYLFANASCWHVAQLIDTWRRSPTSMACRPITYS